MKKNKKKKYKFYEKGVVTKSEISGSIRERLAHYEGNDWPEYALKDPNIGLRVKAYQKLGFTNRSKRESEKKVRFAANDYFKKCQEVLQREGIDSYLANDFFSKEEAILLRMNGIPVSEEMIIKDTKNE